MSDEAVRVLGTEQEYGIALAGVDPREAPHPMHLANAVIRAYRDDTANPEVGFDFEAETPLADQWGFELAREEADDDLLTHVNPMANRMLVDGARFYVDHAHPEYSSPESTSVLDAVAYDRAGDVIMQRAAAAASAAHGVEIRLYKNNTDGKGASYGTHENYLLDRAVPFERVVAGFTPFLATRGVITGAGRVGIGQQSEAAGFQLTQRADFFERPVGLETTIRRPIINTRDEPHADPRTARRLHVITGDANQSTHAAMIRIGSAALVLTALQAGLLPDLELADPVATMRAVSHDLSCRQPLSLADGRRLSALDVQEAYLDAAAHAWERTGVLGAEGERVLDAWDDAITTLRADPARAADRLDWAAKLRLLEGFRARDGLTWDSPRLAAIDLQYADIDPDRSLALRLERSGRLRAAVSAEDVERAVAAPPATTRAYLRGELLRRFGPDVAAMNWDSVTVRLRGGQRRVLRLPDPLGFGAAAAGDALAAAPDVDALVRALFAS